MRSGVSQRGGPVRLYLAGDGQLAMQSTWRQSPPGLSKWASSPPATRHTGSLGEGAASSSTGRRRPTRSAWTCGGHQRGSTSRGSSFPRRPEDRVWVGLLDPASPETVRALRAVAEVTIDGVVTVGPTRPPEGRWPVAAVLGRSVVRAQGGRARALGSSDRSASCIASRRVSTGPTHGNLLAMVRHQPAPPHHQRCRLGRGGSSGRRPRARADSAASTGSVRPRRADARPAGGGLERPGPDRDRLALIELPSGNGRVVKGSKVPGGWVLVAWASFRERGFPDRR